MVYLQTLNICCAFLYTKLTSNLHDSDKGLQSFLLKHYEKVNNNLIWNQPSSYKSFKELIMKEKKMKKAYVYTRSKPRFNVMKYQRYSNLLRLYNYIQAEATHPNTCLIWKLY